MSWDVEYTGRFEQWWDALTADEQVSVAAHVELLERLGPHLPYPHSSAVRGSRHAQLRELRVQHAGRPYRVLYAFDSRRTAIVMPTDVATKAVATNEVLHLDGLGGVVRQPGPRQRATAPVSST